MKKGISWYIKCIYPHVVVVAEHQFYWKLLNWVNIYHRSTDRIINVVIGKNLM